MSIYNVYFLAGLLVASAVYFWLPGVRLRQLCLALGNAAFVFAFAPDAQSLVAMVLWLASGYVVARVLMARPDSRLLAIYVAGMVAAFVILKRYEFLELFLPRSILDHSLSIVGLSYMLFRQIHVVVDARQGQIESLPFWTYLNYQTNLFGLLAGPIQRYQDFADDWNRLEPLSTDAAEILKTYRRIFIGVLKVVALSEACLAGYNWAAASLLSGGQALSGPFVRWRALGTFLAFFYLYPAYIYFNFSGYCDLVIGAARLFGIRMPENFEWPFFGRNMIDYWTRWHKTLGLWIRDYVFTPMYMAIAGRWSNRAASLAFVCYFFAFFLTGVWHGSTWNFLIFGILNGIGVAAAKLWENHLLKRRGRLWYKQYLQSKLIRAASIFVTFHFVCITILFFPADMHKTLTVLRSFAMKLF